jgi:hypothetical protein
MKISHPSSLETLMKRTLLLAALTIFCAVASAQSPAPQAAAPQSQNTTVSPAGDLSSRVPTAKPEDVKSIDAILHALYDVISGPAGERDWNRFRSLFVPEARLTAVTKRPDGTAPVRLLSVDDYVKGAGGYFAKNGFFESAIVNRVQKFGNVAQVFSSYESRHAAAEKSFTRGINSIQLLNDGSRWYVLSILWDEETPANPLPAEMSTSAPAKP